MPRISDIKRVWVGDRPVKRIWYEGKIIWPTTNPHLVRWQGLISTLWYTKPRDRQIISLTGGQTSGRLTLPAISEEWWNTGAIWAVMEENSSVTIQQGTRAAFTLRRAGSTLTVKSTSYKGLLMEASTTCPATGTVLVKADADTQWYGYWIQVQAFDQTTGKALDPKDVGNGGGFKKGETLFTKGDIYADYSGVHYLYVGIGSRSWGLDELTEGQVIENNIAIEIIQQSGSSEWKARDLFPIDLLDVWIISSGTNGTDGDSYTRGRQGKDGKGIKLPASIFAGTLTVTNPPYPTFFSSGGKRYSSETGVPITGGYENRREQLRFPSTGVYPKTRVGRGGSAGKRSDNYSDRQGGAGARGGLVALYKWT